MPDLVGWRIDKRKWAATAFSGAGAAAVGGRWNSANVSVVYLSANLAMSAFETYIHLPKPVPVRMELVRFRVQFDDSFVKRLDEARLPTDWRAAPVPISTQAIGDEWVRSGESAILAVPSAVIPEELNFVLNPAHPDFQEIVIEAPERFSFDYRLARLEDPGANLPNLI